MKLLPILFALVLSSAALAQGYVCAEGGGNPGKGAWADEVFGWMVEKGQKGPAVIIGAIALDAADLPDNREALFKKLGAKSCTSLVINEKNADTQEIYDAITAASIVFIRGGAQERYVNWWKGTKTEKAIHAVFDKGGVIAGTSAGCAILGEVSYDSKVGSLKPTEALEDSCHKNLTLTTDFLGLVPGVLFDTHFTERGRIGRLPVMLAHVRDNLHKDDIIGLGVDPRTAVCVEPHGTAQVRGEGSVTLIEFTMGTRTQLDPGKPPAIAGAFYSRLPAGTVLDLKAKTVTSALDKVPELVRPAGLTAATLDGRGSDAAVPIQGDEDKVKAKPAPAPPLVRWAQQDDGGAVILTQNTWAHPSELVLQAITTTALVPGRVALFLSPGNKAEAHDDHLITIHESKNDPSSAAVIIDTGVERLAVTEWRHQVDLARGNTWMRKMLPHMEAREKQLWALVDKHGKRAEVEREKKLVAAESNFVTFEDTDLSARYAAQTRNLLLLRDAVDRVMPAEFKEEGIKEDPKDAAEGAALDTSGRFTPITPQNESEILKNIEADQKGVHPAIYRAKLHILPPGWTFDTQSGEVTRPTPAKTEPKAQSPQPASGKP